MRPKVLRLALVTTLAAASLVVAANVSATADLSTCTLVASEGTDPSPLGTILEAVAALDDDDVWAVGGHVVGPVSSPYAQHWDGTAWTSTKLDVPEGPIGISSLYDIKAFAADDVWAVGSWMGEHPLVEHWDGQRWSMIAVPELGGSEGILTGVDGTSADDVWIVGQHRVDRQEHAVVLHGGLSGFRILPPPDATVLHAVAMYQDGAPLVSGWRINQDGFADAFIANWTGSGWREEVTPEKEEANAFLFGLAVGRNRVWAVGFSNVSPDGDSPFTLTRGPHGWQELDEPDLGPSTRLVSVGSGGAGTVAVGVVSDGGASRAVAVKLDGTGWTAIPGAGSQPPDALADVAVTDQDVWAVGRAVVVGATYGVPAARVYSCG
jgi:hypothetical protein